jgi:hypothetical protein
MRKGPDYDMFIHKRYFFGYPDFLASKHLYYTVFHSFDYEPDDVPDDGYPRNIVGSNLDIYVFIMTRFQIYSKPYSFKLVLMNFISIKYLVSDC